MTQGVESRLRNLFSASDHRALCVACDHGLMTDPKRSWLGISEVVRASIQKGVDGLLLSAGQIRRFEAEYGFGELPPVIVRTDWTNMLRLSEKPADLSQMLPVEQIEYRRLMVAQEVLFRYRGSAAIGFLFIDPDHQLETQTLKSSHELVQECHTVGLPCIIEVLPLVTRAQSGQAEELLSYGIRLALELGADAIKMPLTTCLSEHCDQIHRAGRLLFILGGSNLSDEILFLNLMKQALDAGVDGLLVGRNISKSQDPALLISKLRDLVHPGKVSI